MALIEGVSRMASATGHPALDLPGQIAADQIDIGLGRPDCARAARRRTRSRRSLAGTGFVSALWRRSYP